MRILQKYIQQSIGVYLWMVVVQDGLSTFPNMKYDFIIKKVKAMFNIKKESMSSDGNTKAQPLKVGKDLLREIRKGFSKQAFLMTSLTQKIYKLATA